LHAAILIPDRKAYTDFIRELTSKLVFYFSKIAKIKFKKIFLNRPFTRIVEWGKAFEKLKKYMLKNEIESGVQQVLSKIQSMKQKQDSGQLLLFDD
jgi:hypothetical protein